MKILAHLLRAALGSALVVVFLHFSAQAQNPNATHQDNGGLNGSLSREDLQKLGGDHKNEPKDTPELRAKAKTQSVALLESLKITCDASDAKLIVAGTIKPKGGSKQVDARVYEVACTHAMGYLLETQGSEPPIAISCLSAEEARAADVARAKEPSFFCKLPGNADVYGLVSAMIMEQAAAQCTVGKLQLFGRSASTHTEYSEVACTDGNGFMLRMAQPGFEAKTVVMSCRDAAKQNIKCKLTDPGPVEAQVTAETLKDALAHNGVACSIAQIRVIGQEEHLKRYVVEYLCADKATGMVAFLPLPGNTNPFESQDCAAAAADRGVTCSLAPPK
ncbi:MAG TPA: hypothetical protein VGI90_06565 [Steroidobacteraceae bacterium]|jgi:hypothetical protein